jgi:hypothetical protein
MAGILEEEEEEEVKEAEKQATFTFFCRKYVNDSSGI